MASPRSILQSPGLPDETSTYPFGADIKMSATPTAFTPATRPESGTFDWSTAVPAASPPVSSLTPALTTSTSATTIIRPLLSVDPTGGAFAAPSADRSRRTPARRPSMTAGLDVASLEAQAASHPAVVVPQILSPHHFSTGAHSSNQSAVDESPPSTNGSLSAPIPSASPFTASASVLASFNHRTRAMPYSYAALAISAPSPPALPFFNRPNSTGPSLTGSGYMSNIITSPMAGGAGAGGSIPLSTASMNGLSSSSPSSPTAGSSANSIRAPMPVRSMLVAPAAAMRHTSGPGAVAQQLAAMVKDEALMDDDDGGDYEADSRHIDEMTEAASALQRSARRKKASAKAREAAQVVDHSDSEDAADDAQASGNRPKRARVPTARAAGARRQVSEEADTEQEIAELMRELQQDSEGMDSENDDDIDQGDDGDDGKRGPGSANKRGGAASRRQRNRDSAARYRRRQKHMTRVLQLKVLEMRHALVAMTVERDALQAELNRVRPAASAGTVGVKRSAPNA